MEKSIAAVNVVQPEFKDRDAVKFLRDYASAGVRAGIDSVLVISVTKEGYVNWDYSFASDEHMALTALAMEDVRDDVKAALFGE